MTPCAAADVFWWVQVPLQQNGSLEQTSAKALETSFNSIFNSLPNIFLIYAHYLQHCTTGHLCGMNMMTSADSRDEEDQYRRSSHYPPRCTSSARAPEYHSSTMFQALTLGVRFSEPKIRVKSCTGVS